MQNMSFKTILLKICKHTKIHTIYGSGCCAPKCCVTGSIWRWLTWEILVCFSCWCSAGLLVCWFARLLVCWFAPSLGVRLLMQSPVVDGELLLKWWSRATEIFCWCWMLGYLYFTPRSRRNIVQQCTIIAPSGEHPAIIQLIDEEGVSALVVHCCTIFHLRSGLRNIVQYIDQYRYPKDNTEII